MLDKAAKAGKSEGKGVSSVRLFCETASGSARDSSDGV